MVIDQFILQYKRDYPIYERLAQICARQCESSLERNGIHAIVTFRAKRIDRLREKVEKRAKRKNYQTIDDIFRDIHDLAGVRIALYFPGDRKEVDSFIHSQFIVEEQKDFPERQIEQPYQRRFAGYTARHYRVRLRKETLSEHDAHLLGDRFLEIQTGSVLMHAWAEVEHDLVYKPQTGRLSDDEYAILDELNGLVHAGEIALERLQQAVRRRVSTNQMAFTNHFELSSFLYDRVRKTNGSDPVIGRADVLFRFLELSDLNSPSKIEKYLDSIDPDAENRPIAEQIADQILSENEHLYETYNRARLLIGESDPYGRPDEAVSYFSEERALGFFMRRWIAVETVIRTFLGEAIANKDIKRLASLNEARLRLVDSGVANRLEKIRRIRNQVIHGKEFPSEQELMEAGRFLEGLLRKIIDEQPEAAAVIEEVLGNSKSNGQGKHG